MRRTALGDRTSHPEPAVVARDFSATLAFYRRLALEVPNGSSSPEGVRHTGLTLPNGLALESDDEALARLYNAAWRRPGGSSRLLLGFSLPSRDEVDRLYRALTAAGYRPPKNSPHPNQARETSLADEK